DQGSHVVEDHRKEIHLGTAARSITVRGSDAFGAEGGDEFVEQPLEMSLAIDRSDTDHRAVGEVPEQRRNVDGPPVGEDDVGRWRPFGWPGLRALLSTCVELPADGTVVEKQHVAGPAVAVHERDGAIAEVVIERLPEIAIPGWCGAPECRDKGSVVEA